MSENFNLEIIGPENTVLKIEVIQVKIRCFEGLMSVLKDHISLVTFLRPGLVEVRSDKGDENFFVEDGTVELNNNNLLILSSTAKNIKELSKDDMDKMIKDSEEKIKDEKIIDKEKYVLYYKINTLKEIRQ